MSIVQQSYSRPEFKADLFYRDVVEGLSRSKKHLPSKYFYDERGSRLFEEITRLPEYYLTRTEIAILEQHVQAISFKLGSQPFIIEFGSGSSLKTRILLDHVDASGYAPVDISGEHLLHSARKITRRYKHIPVFPIAADYTMAMNIPDTGTHRRVAFFPGSTIGNFLPGEAESFFSKVGELVGGGGGFLLGVDAKKPRHLLEAAYNDSQGVTAAFNKNILRRINRELSGNFDLNLFTHHAFYNGHHGRVEMHLVSTQCQCVTVGETSFDFIEGESICTEYSYKYTIDDLRALAERSGFVVDGIWQDRERLFFIGFLKFVASC